MTAVLPSLPTGWVRRRDEAVLAGVCALLARQLHVPAWLLRTVTTVLALVVAPGMLSSPDPWAPTAELSRFALLVSAVPLLLYSALWWAIPDDVSATVEQSRQRDLDAVRGRPGQAARIEAGPSLPGPLRWGLMAAIAGGAVLATVEVVILDIGMSDPFVTGFAAFPSVLLGTMAGSVVLGLLPLNDLDRDRWAGSGGRGAVAALLCGVAALLVVTALGALTVLGPRGALLLFTAIILVGTLLALLLVPWGRRLWSSLRAETEQRAVVLHQQETTAHLHDSVLQTLVVMQRPTLDAEELRRLARRQERELRRWLYQDTDESPHTDLRAAVQELTAELEDTHGTEVHTVVVGDAELTELMRPLLGALREATANACRHGRDDVDVFVDVSARTIEAYVRDRGPGFDLAAVPEDRLGVRESIIGRMQRAGGTATVRPAPGGGTEVALELPRRSR